RWFDNQQILALFLAPRRKHRNEWRVRPHRELGNDKRSRSRNSEKIDKNRFVVEGVQVRENTEWRFTGPQYFPHRPRRRDLVDCPVAEPAANAIHELLDARIVESAHEKSERMIEQGESEAGQLPRTEMARVENQTIATNTLRGNEVSNSLGFDELFELVA